MRILPQRLAAEGKADHDVELYALRYDVTMNDD
jgi:hypothetical protein